MALRAASVNGRGSRLAASMIPSLVKQYLMDCPIGEFAPVDYGGAQQPFSKMTALVLVLLQVYRKKVQEEDSPPSDPAVLTDLSNPEAQTAMAELVEEAVSARWDGRTFAVTAEDTTENNKMQLTLYSQCGISGRSWPKSIGKFGLPGLRRCEKRRVPRLC